MKAIEAVTNLHTDDIERARDFFRFLGLTEDGMNQGWVARFASADSSACVQVVTRDATAAEDSVMTIKVDDVDAAYDEARRRGYEVVHPITDEPYGGAPVGGRGHPSPGVDARLVVTAGRVRGTTGRGRARRRHPRGARGGCRRSELIRSLSSTPMTPRRLPGDGSRPRLRASR